MMHRRWKSCGLMVLVLMAVSSCRSSAVRDDKSVDGPTPVFVLVIEGPTSVLSGESATFKAILVNAADNARRDVTQEATWISSNPGLAKIDRGSVSGQYPGLVLLEVRFEQWNARMPVTIATHPDLAAAALEIDLATVQVFGPDALGWFGYLVKFRLRETAGKNSALIGDIAVKGPNGSDMTGPECWRDNLIVPAGGTLDAFHSDEGLKWLAYCAPGSGGRTATPTLRVTVSFVDSGGHAGKVETDISR